MATAVDNYRDKLLARGRAHLERLANRFEASLQSADFVRAERFLNKYEDSEARLELLDLNDDASAFDCWRDMHRRFMAARFGPSDGEEACG